MKKEAENHAIRALMDFKNELLKERLRQVEIKEKYGVKSLESLIRKYDLKLIEYEVQKEEGSKDGHSNTDGGEGRKRVRESFGGIEMGDRGRRT